MTKVIIFKELCDLWLNAVKGTVKDNTYRYTYLNNVKNHLLPEFNNAKIDNIKLYNLQEFINKQATIYKRDTVIKMTRVIKQIFNFAIDCDIISKNPAYHLIVPKYQDEEKDIQIYTELEVKYIFDYAKNHRFGIPIMVLLETGMRKSELLGLKWEDFDTVKRILRIRRSVSELKASDTEPMRVVVSKTKNNTSRRDIPISDELCTYINSVKKTSEYIFPNIYGNVQCPSTWTRKRYMRFMREMQQHYKEKGIDIPILSPHKLHHTRASIWVNKGLNLYAIAKVLGHSDLKMLEKRYAHSNVEQLRILLEI